MKRLFAIFAIIFLMVGVGEMAAQDQQYPAPYDQQQAGAGSGPYDQQPPVPQGPPPDASQQPQAPPPPGQPQAQPQQNNQAQPARRALVLSTATYQVSAETTASG